MPSDHHTILDQLGALAVLERGLAQQRLAQAYLFEGPSGVGKQRTALAWAAAAMAGAQRLTPPLSPSDTSLLARIVAGQHPDVRLFRPRDEGHRNLPVELLREEILPFAQYAPFEASRAFIIFSEADVCFPQQHAEAANALLKTLEEPRPHVHFILLSDRPDRLLPTIRSRCQRVRFTRLGAETLTSILEQHGVDAAQRGPAVALADGQADRALALAQDDQAKQLLDQALQLDKAVAQGGAGRLLALSEELARQDELPAVLDALAIMYRDMAAIRLGSPDAALRFCHDTERLRARAEHVPPEEAASRVRLLQHVTRSFERNANRAVALDAMLLQLRNARRYMSELDARPVR